MTKTGFLITILLSAAIAGCSPRSEKTTNDKSGKDIVLDNILSRRSIRKYRDAPLDSVSLREILLCGINAPNGQGRESWEVRVVTDSEFIEEIDRSYNEYVTNTLKLDKAKHHVSYGAPTLVFIAYDTTYDLSQVDCGLLGGNMMLAANAMGIGSCCLGGLCRFVNSEEGTEILRKLKIPSTHRLLYAIAFGYPAENPAAKPRNPNRIKFIENE